MAEVVDEGQDTAQDPNAVKKEQKSWAVGIDLGTTYSCVGVYKDDEVQIIANDQGNRTTPSYVAWAETERLMGDAAKNQVANNPTNTVFDAKRLIGRKFKEEIVQKDMKLWPFRVVSDGSPDDKPLIAVVFQGVEKKFHPEEISSMVLTKMKQTAEAYLGTRVRNAVVTVPAYFNDSQRQATKDAGEIAGLNVLRIVNEPTAAAIAYGLDQQTEKERAVEQNILVFDMGGGTFDVSILQIQDTIFEVKATAGDPHLGGEDFDNRMLSFCIAEFRRKHNTDPSRNQRAIRRLRTQCERAKRSLSSQTAVTIEVDSLHDGHDFSVKMSRAKFEELNIDYFKKAMEPVSQCLNDSGLDKLKIKEVVMVGGSTRIPKVQAMIQAFFNGKQLCKEINPDEAVAYGAAVQAAIVTGAGSSEVSNMLLLDVAPLSLGLEVAGGMMAKLIERNSTVPTNKSQDFTTSEDNQEFVEVKVYEGERPKVKDNNYLGLFRLNNIPKTLRGVPKIKVTFTVDTDGILEVKAEDVKTHNKADIKITNEKGRLSQAQIEKMLADAEEFKDEDELAMGEMQAREELKSYLNRARQAIDDIGDKVTEVERENMTSKLKSANEWFSTRGERSTKEECEAKQKDVEIWMNVIMMRINRAETDFFSHKVDLPDGENTVYEGGYFLGCGKDIRDLIDKPE